MAKFRKMKENGSKLFLEKWLRNCKEQEREQRGVGFIVG